MTARLLQPTQHGSLSDEPMAPTDWIDHDTPVYTPEREFSQTAQQVFELELRAALSVRPRRIAPKFFYDAEGSRLFDRICELPEYYPTRVEVGLLTRHAFEMAELIGPGADLVEFGAGSATKVRLLLDALVRPKRFIPIDISADHLQASAAQLRLDYPGLDVQPLAADFTHPFSLPPSLRRVGFFPGSSIGNFDPLQAVNFLRLLRGHLAGGGLLIGVDLIKEPDTLHRAYNDAAGVTAAFNRNLLTRANRELGTDFIPEQFAHHALYDPVQQRIEMHLVSRRRQTVHLRDQAFEFAEGESLHTENSWKYSVEGFQDLARSAGYVPGPVWVDPERLFSVHWLRC